MKPLRNSFANPRLTEAISDEGISVDTRAGAFDYRVGILANRPCLALEAVLLLRQHSHTDSDGLIFKDTKHYNFTDVSIYSPVFACLELLRNWPQKQ